jgi:hypothetical protein
MIAAPLLQVEIKMKNRWFLILCLMLACASLLAANQATNLRDFMRAKLKHSQTVLDGLVRGDMVAVGRGAQDLKLLSLESTWQVLQTEQYINYSRQFRADADALAEAAKKNNLDAATTAFNKVTTRCVECHKYVRDVRMAKK